MGGVGVATAQQPRLGSLGINLEESVKRLFEYGNRLQQANDRLAGGAPDVSPPSPIAPSPVSSIGMLEKTEMDFRRVLDTLAKEVSRVEEL